MDADQTLSSHNIAFLEALYEQYERDPESVDPKWRALIDHERGRNGTTQPARRWPPTNGHGRTAALSDDAEQVALQSSVDRLIENYRLIGHLRADIDPLGRPRQFGTEGLDLDYFGLSKAHLDRRFHPGKLFQADSVTLREILGKLQRTYTRKVGVEYWQINDVEQRAWLRERMESVENEIIPDPSEQIHLLRSLTRTDAADAFLHSKFIGAKRFSISGAESVIALLETLIEDAGDLGVKECIFGMAHRGRLSVMMNVMGQTPTQIFSRFEGGDPYENLGAGDVKYHLGCYRNITTRRGKDMYLALAFNPSHLEAITPVIAGRIRASQDRLPPERRSEVLGVTMHGDAAVAGQGVYAETLNLSQLPGYANQGTIRVVINNQIGFTTNPDEGRSTIYATAVADMLNIPIFHINGDDPEAAAYVAQLAVEFRQRFHKDVIIDLLCYRRFGHNEADEPTFTQPQMYEWIKKLPSVRQVYETRLIERGTVTHDECQRMKDEYREELEAALEEVRSTTPSVGRSPMHGRWEAYQGGPDANVREADTSAPTEQLQQVGKVITTIPDGFHLHRKLERFVADTRDMLAGEAPVNWSVAEQLAYGTLCLSGAHVRISGQDSIRGTFTHRHVGWTDTKTAERYFPLQHVAPDQGRFNVYNSPLSEFAVLGFEFGYSLAAPDTLIIWEAQFGDFANGAQVIIDQFMSSSEDKWNRVSGLVLFLPHGYEGQGPEHSSARLERFLQLCAEDNMQVCNLTTPAQMFHALRRQLLRPWRKPLVIMTPKSLLRTRQSFSPISEFSEGRFQRFIDDRDVEAAAVQRIMMCSGKVYYDLVNARTERERGDVAILRVEQLFPFPQQQIEEALKRYPNAKDLLWVQEEPRNMGSWFFIRPLLEELAGGRFDPRFVGRAASASPATGSPESHKLEQDMIIQEAFDND